MVTHNYVIKVIGMKAIQLIHKQFGVIMIKDSRDLFMICLCSKAVGYKPVT